MNTGCSRVRLAVGVAVASFGLLGEVCLAQVAWPADGYWGMATFGTAQTTARNSGKNMIFYPRPTNCSTCDSIEYTITHRDLEIERGSYVAWGGFDIRHNFPQHLGNLAYVTLVPPIVGLLDGRAAEGFPDGLGSGSLALRVSGITRSQLGIWLRENRPVRDVALLDGSGNPLGAGRAVRATTMRWLAPGEPAARPEWPIYDGFVVLRASGNQALPVANFPLPWSWYRIGGQDTRMLTFALPAMGAALPGGWKVVAVIPRGTGDYSFTETEPLADTQHTYAVFTWRNRQFDVYWTDAKYYTINDISYSRGSTAVLSGALPPTDLAATPGNRRVALQWANGGAAGVVIARAPTNGGDLQTLFPAQLTPGKTYVAGESLPGGLAKVVQLVAAGANAWEDIDDNLANGSSYGYAIYSRFPDGSYSGFAAIAATPTFADQLPTWLNPLPLATAVKLEWQNPTANNLAGIKLERRLAGEATWTERFRHDAGPPVPTTHWDTNLTPGATYVYRLVALDQDGDKSQAVDLETSTLNTLFVELRPGWNNVGLPVVAGVRDGEPTKAGELLATLLATAGVATVPDLWRWHGRRGFVRGNADPLDEQEALPSYWIFSEAHLVLPLSSQRGPGAGPRAPSPLAPGWHNLALDLEDDADIAAALEPLLGGNQLREVWRWSPFDARLEAVGNSRTPPADAPLQPQAGHWLLVE